MPTPRLTDPPLRILAAAGSGLAVATAIVVAARAWLVVDTCLDAGGRVDASGWCETDSGRWILESSYSRTAGIAILIVALVAGSVAFTGTRAFLRSRASRAS